MSEDRLEEIQSRYDYKNPNGDFFYEAIVCGVKTEIVKDMSWLISELEKCRAENKELNRIFDFQLERMDEADKLWQDATGKHDTSPDLGVLLEWLMAEIKQLEKRIDDWRGAVSSETDRGMEWKDKAEKAEAEVKRLKAILADMGIYF